MNFEYLRLFYVSVPEPEPESPEISNSLVVLVVVLNENKVFFHSRVYF